MHAITTKNLTKRFGSFTAVDRVNINVKPGEIYALIGPNGAGKSTFIKMLVGLLIPDGGSASVAGFDVTNRPISAKSETGYVSDDPSPYDYLTGLEFLMLTGRLRGLKEAAVKNRIGTLTGLFPISEIISTQITRYSRGNKQKIAILAALMTEPKVLIIDEPIVGLDPASIDILGSVLETYAQKGNAVLFATHILEFARKYAKHVGVMKAGSIVKETDVSRNQSLEKLL